MNGSHPSRTPPTPPGPTPAPGDNDAAATFLDVIPDLAERAAAFRVSSEFVDDAVLAAFHRQMEAIRSALTSALEDADPGDPALIALPPSEEQVWDAAQVRLAIDALPDDEREIVRLQHLQGFTQQ